MLTFISCAKTMTAKTKIDFSNLASTPAFKDFATQHAIEVSHLSTEDLGKLLHINPKLAAENTLRYQDFLSDSNRALPALLSYTGMVFKRINATDFSTEDFNYAQNHLLITSFLYGLLRPMDLIKNYRLEGNVKLNSTQGESMFNFWKPILTDFFIHAIKEQGGILINLASEEMKSLFDWKKVCSEVRVITPDFYTIKNGKLAAVTVYAKMCRGEMTRFILKNRIENPEELKAFEWEGFCFDESRSSEENFMFIMG